MIKRGPSSGDRFVCIGILFSCILQKRRMRMVGMPWFMMNISKHPLVRLGIWFMNLQHFFPFYIQKQLGVQAK